MKPPSQKSLDAANRKAGRRPRSDAVTEPRTIKVEITRVERPPRVFKSVVLLGPVKQARATKAEKWKAELERTLEGFNAGTVTFESAGRKVIEVESGVLSGLRDGTITARESNVISRIASKIISAQKKYIADVGRRSS